MVNCCAAFGAGMQFSEIAMLRDTEAIENQYNFKFVRPMAQLY
jgi:hypothetical protein